jgi:hypothetical protein
MFEVQIFRSDPTEASLVALAKAVRLIHIIKGRAALMKLPKFDADQMILVIVICLIGVALSLWRLFTLF